MKVNINIPPVLKSESHVARKFRILVRKWSDYIEMFLFTLHRGEQSRRHVVRDSYGPSEVGLDSLKDTA